ncbi:uncharacterized protein [Arachis hypogaea]|uniref:uncharacterized protein n=1 Tax=Arachis hypogaea TaxID=3818 RepID=UPI003B2205E3
MELTPDEHNKTWELHVDGASNREGSGVGIILKEGDGVIAEQALQFHFAASSKQQPGRVRGPHSRTQARTKPPSTKPDSTLRLPPGGSTDPREQNVRADILSKLAATRADTQTSALSQLTLTKPSTELLYIENINRLHDWRAPFLEYINTGTIPSTEPNQQHFRRKASFYTKIAGELYRCDFSQPLLKCLNKDEAREVMNEIHKGVCGNHIGGRTLAAKIARTGYYWPTMKRDCLAKVKACDKCQKHEAISTKPAEVLHSMEAEAANRVVLQAIKKKLDNAKGEWAELIPKILWSYNTTVQNTTSETPFRLVYGSEALIPVEIEIPTLRAELYDEQHNTRARNAELDLAEEDREIAAIKQRAQKQLAEKKHNKRVVPRIFSEGDLVLRRIEEVRRPHSHGKLATNWEGHSEYQKYSEWGLTNFKHYKATQCRGTGMSPP